MHDEAHRRAVINILRELVLSQREYQTDRWIEALLGGRLRFHDAYQQDTRTYDRWRELHRTAY